MYPLASAPLCDNFRNTTLCFANSGVATHPLMAVPAHRQSEPLESFWGNWWTRNRTYTSHCHSCLDAMKQKSRQLPSAWYAEHLNPQSLYPFASPPQNNAQLYSWTLPLTMEPRQCLQACRRSKDCPCPSGPFVATRRARSRRCGSSVSTYLAHPSIRAHIVLAS